MTAIHHAAWDQIATEPDEDFELFARYLAYPVPVLGEFAASVGLNPGTLGRIAARWRWRARRAALNNHLSELRVSAAEHEARDVGADIARSWAVAVELAGNTLRSALALEECSVKDAVKILVEANKHLRLDQGQATEIVDIQTLGSMSDAELAAAQELLSKLTKE
jgi:hypothetical protein